MNQITYRKTEQGNVLFLILIAVALFAALSYAVTQSTRSGGGSADRETSILNSASMTQYPASLRTSIIRMILAGTTVDAMLFNPPSAFSGTTNVEVFHPNGGGALFQNAQGDLMATLGSGTWLFNANFFIPEIGIDTVGAGSDLIAFLPGVASNICQRINTEFDVITTDCAASPTAGVPLFTPATPAKLTQLIDTAGDFSTQSAAAEELQGDDSGGTCNAFSGQPSGCFYVTTDVDGDGSATDYVFYSTLLER